MNFNFQSFYKKNIFINRIKHYHNWLRNAHAIKKQAKSMLKSMASRINNYPKLRARIKQHLSKTKNQIVQLKTILDRNNISRSVIKDSISKMAALGQSINGIFPSNKIVKGSISKYVFKQFKIACYTSLLAAAKNANNTASIPTIKAILNKKKQMANWLIQNIPQTTKKFLIRSKTNGVKAKK